MWRCVNDWWGYCYNEPSWKKKPKTSFASAGSAVAEAGFVTQGECVNDPKTCSQYLTFSQVCQLQQNKAASQSPG